LNILKNEQIKEQIKNENLKILQNQQQLTASTTKTEKVQDLTEIGELVQISEDDQEVHNFPMINVDIVKGVAARRIIAVMS
jgi:hypothetical protein